MACQRVSFHCVSCSACTCNLQTSPCSSSGRRPFHNHLATGFKQLLLGRCHLSKSRSGRILCTVVPWSLFPACAQAWQQNPGCWQLEPRLPWLTFRPITSLPQASIRRSRIWKRLWPPHGCAGRAGSPRLRFPWSRRHVKQRLGPMEHIPPAAVWNRFHAACIALRGHGLFQVAVKSNILPRSKCQPHKARCACRHRAICSSDQKYVTANNGGQGIQGQEHAMEFCMLLANQPKHEVGKRSWPNVMPEACQNSVSN